MPWVALVGPEEEENLSLRYLAASLSKAGFCTEIVPFNAAHELPQVLDSLVNVEEPPAVVGISLTFQWRARDFLALAIALKERSYHGHVTAGGHFGTFAGEELLRDFPELDSVCRHEAETTIVELTRAVVSGRSLEHIAGLAYRDTQGRPVLKPVPEPAELDLLPWPERTGDPQQCLGHGMAPIVGSRGCYANCTFCCIAAWHALAPSSRRFRLREVRDVADEMAWLHRQRGIDIFIFHDDNFFVRNRQRNLERIHALADALEARGVTRFGTMIKARPTDVTKPIFQAVRDRLRCIRVYLGIETDAEQGLRTLARGVRRQENHESLRTLEDLGVFVSFNLLIFDPDTTIASLEANLSFMEAFAETPSNFGRVELYAGTPLLARMKAEGRCRGDYLGWDYRLANRDIELVFRLAARCFDRRNFAPDALANHLQGTRLQVEVCRRFHPDVYQDHWLVEARELSRRLALDSAAGLREITSFAQTNDSAHASSFAQELIRRLHRTEDSVRRDAERLEEAMRSAVGVESGMDGFRSIRTATARAVAACRPSVDDDSTRRYGHGQRTIR